MRWLESVSQDEQLSHRAKAVYFYLRDRADPQGICWPALGTIARELSLSRSTVKRAVQDLKAAGYLETQQRWRQNGGKSSLRFRLLK